MMNFFKKHSTKIVVLVVNSLLVATGAMAINNQQKEKESLMAINNQSNDSEIPTAWSDAEVPMESASAIIAPDTVNDENISKPAATAPIVNKPVVTTTKPKSTTTSQTTETKSTTASTPKVVSSPAPAPTPAPVVKSEPAPAPKPVAKTKAS